MDVEALIIEKALLLKNSENDLHGVSKKISIQNWKQNDFKKKFKAQIQIYEINKDDNIHKSVALKRQDKRTLTLQSDRTEKSEYKCIQVVTKF